MFFRSLFLFFICIVSAIIVIIRFPPSHQNKIIYYFIIIYLFHNNWYTIIIGGQHRWASSYLANYNMRSIISIVGLYFCAWLIKLLLFQRYTRCTVMYRYTGCTVSVVRRCILSCETFSQRKTRHQRHLCRQFGRSTVQGSNPARHQGLLAILVLMNNKINRDELDDRRLVGSRVPLTCEKRHGRKEEGNLAPRWFLEVGAEKRPTKIMFKMFVYSFEGLPSYYISMGTILLISCHLA